MKVKKKDWVAAKNQFEAMKINALINIECYQNNIFWYDSCGNRSESFIIECLDCEVCATLDGSIECYAQSTSSRMCFGNDVYFVDSCGGQGDMAVDCDDCQVCADTECQSIPTSVKKCFDNSVYKIDSCDGPYELVTACNDGDICRESETDAQCCISGRGTRCGPDGDVYFVDSCGEQGDLAIDCHNTRGECLTLSENEAQCGCVGPWTMESNCETQDFITIYDIQNERSQGHPPENSDVRLENVAVTAIYSNGSFFVQETEGGVFSGISIYNTSVDIRPLTLGTRITLEGTYSEYENESQIALHSFAVISQGQDLQPEVVSSADLATESSTAEQYEGVLVKVENVTVNSANPDGPNNDFGEFLITGHLRIDNGIFEITPAPQVGDNFVSLTGVMRFSSSNTKLDPRREEDVIKPTCTGDYDCDGHIDSMDNCPTVYNPGQEDVNGNTIGDACE